jgi:Leucine-rich repeat (LRR) protein
MIDTFSSGRSKSRSPSASPTTARAIKSSRGWRRAAGKCLATASALFILGLSAAKTLANPVQFYDPNLQTCVDEHMAANAWSSAEEVTYLECSRRGVVDAVGIEQLPNLVKLDLSHNPLQHAGYLDNLKLQEVNLSHTRLYDLHSLGGQASLKKLLLNDISFENAADASQRETLLHSLLINNPNLTHLGINGFQITDHNKLFYDMPRGLVSLQISDIGLPGVPVPLDEFAGLLLLDVSENPLQHLGPMYNLQNTLEYLDVSGTQLSDLYELTQLRSLTHIFLNNVRFAATFGPIDREAFVNDILIHNPNITHLGISGLKISDFERLFHNFSPNLATLELSNTGLMFPPIPFDQFQQLKTLDLSHNPLEHLGPLHSLQNQLEVLDISETRIPDLHMLSELRALTKLRLNGIAFSAPQDPISQADIIQQVLNNNPGLVHLGINDLDLADPSQLFSALSPAVEALEFSGLGLTHIPVPLEQYASLKRLDLSNNPLDHVGPLMQLGDTLSYIDLSGTRLYSLYDLTALTNLSHLLLNNIAFHDGAPVEQELFDVLSQNPNLTHVGISGITVNDSYRLFDLLPTKLQALEISNIGLSDDALVPLDRFLKLTKLDVSHNGLLHLPIPPELHHTLEHLNLSGSRLYDSYELRYLRALTHFYLNDTELATSPYAAEQAVQEILANNPKLTHIGLNGLTVTDFPALFQKLSPQLVSLKLSNTGLVYPPVPFDQFPHLEVLNLSHNPLEHLGPLDTLGGQLQVLDISKTRVPDLQMLRGLRALEKLRVNNIAFPVPQDPQVQYDIIKEVLFNNPRLVHVGLNGLVLSNPDLLFHAFSPAVEALELSNIGLMHIPVPLEQYANLKRLDLSNNPLDHVGPLMQLAQTLRYVDLSGTKLYGLYDISELTTLTHLLLNNIAFQDGAPIEQELFDVLSKNPNLTHVGINGITVNDSYRLFDLLPAKLESLEISGVGLVDDTLVPLDRFPKLRKLDASRNGLLHLPVPPELHQTLEYLDVSGSRLYDLYEVKNLRRLTHLYLNNVELMAESYSVELDVNDILANNPRLTHIGLNGLAFTDFQSLFAKFSPNLVSLELSDTGLEAPPVPIEQFTQLKVLDLSHNPLYHLGSLYALQGTLEELNLSNTALHDLTPLRELRALKRLRLNDITFSGPQDPYTQGDIVQETLLNNPALIEVALSGLQISDPYQLFNKLSPDLKVLELAGLGLAQIPVPLEQFTKLRVLDLSGNPLTHVSPLMNLHDTLEQIDLSGTHLYDLYGLQPLTRLTHLRLNNIQFSNAWTPEELEQQLLGLIANNPRLSHVGLSGMPLQPNVINELTLRPLVWLQAAGAGLVDLYLPPHFVEALRHLNLADNALTHTYGLEVANRLEYLNLTNNALTDISTLINGLPAIKVLNLLGNDTIACADVDALEAALAPEVDYTGPTSCGGTTPEPAPEPVQYCSASASSSSYEWIDSVSLGGQLHFSGNNGGYADLTATSFALQRGALTSIQLNPGFGTASYTEYWKVWIDYDRDGNFSTFEEVVSGSSSSSISGQVSVPTNAVIGSVRMRVAMKYGRSALSLRHLHLGRS